MENFSSDLVSIKVTGDGANVWAYAIDAETYARISEDCGDEDPVDVIMDEYQVGQLVCWGIDESSGCTVSMDVAGKSTLLKIVHTYDGYDIDEAVKDRNLSASTPIIEYNSDAAERLGAVFDLSDLSHVFVDSITWKDITLQLTLPVVARDFDQRKLSLLVCGMDSETELSALTYQTGLLNGLEADIIGVIYDGKKYFFQSECKRAFQQRRYIVGRTDDGWEIDEKVTI